MKILVSFCNQQPENCKKNLLLYDLENNQSKYLLENEGSFTGLTQDEDYFYAISQGNRNGIFIIDKKNHSIILKQKLDNLFDPHSILIDGNLIYVVSTGEDKVVEYFFDKNNLRIDFVDYFWELSGRYCKNDINHVNSIFKYNDKIFVSAFGIKKDINKKISAEKGFILDTTNNKKIIENIFHPHSVFIENNNFYYCESMAGKIKKNKESIIEVVSGYVRGLSIKKRTLIFGLSEGRKFSRSSGKKIEKEDVIKNGFCSVFIYKKRFFSNSWKKHSSINLFPEHAEIYDILTVD